MKEEWFDNSKPSNQDLLDHISKFQPCLHDAGEFARENSAKSADQDDNP